MIRPTKRHYTDLLGRVAQPYHEPVARVVPMRCARSASRQFRMRLIALIAEDQTSSARDRNVEGLGQNPSLAPRMAPYRLVLRRPPLVIVKSVWRSPVLSGDLACVGMTLSRLSVEGKHISRAIQCRTIWTHYPSYRPCRLTDRLWYKRLRTTIPRTPRFIVEALVCCPPI